MTGDIVFGSVNLIGGLVSTVIGNETVNCNVSTYRDIRPKKLNYSDGETRATLDRID